MRVNRLAGRAPGVRAATLLVAISASVPAGAVEFSYSGYVREHWSVNLQNNATFEPEGYGPGAYDPAAPGVAFRDTGDTVGGKGDFSMLRHSAKLEGLLSTGLFTFGAVGRANYESRTSYERGLQDMSKQLPAVATLELASFPGFFPGATDVLPGVGGTQIIADGSAFTSDFLNAFLGAPGCAPPAPCPYAPGLPGIGAGTQRSTVLNAYDGTEMREWWVMFDIGERSHFKLGKQQVVWGETDFFRAMDIIHGYDLQWRSFLELENEELRKPLIMANAQFDVPRLGGSFQFIFRPGWDDGRDIGDDQAVRGGRWNPAPWSGADIPGSLLGPYNYHHNKGDENDPSYGVRWAGTLKQIGYSLNYYRGQNTDLVAVRSPLLGPTYGDWEGSNFAVNELVFPRTSTYGITLNAYAEPLDVVLRGEMAYTPDKPYNTGTDTFLDLFRFLGAANATGGGAAGDFVTTGFGPGHVVLNDPGVAGSAYTPGVCNVGPLAGSGVGCAADGSAVLATLAVPGHGPVKEKDTLKIMVGMDKNLRWTMSKLNTSRPAVWTAQLFDTWLLNYDKDDQIVELLAFNAARREHQTFLTNAISLPFNYDTVTFTLAAGVDLGSFDAFVIPSLDLAFGDHWRVRLEADIFLPRHVKPYNLGVPESGGGRTRTLGTLNDRDQLAMRVTYQF